jgi:hypothetical protein
MGQLRVDCPATQRENFAQITRERMCANEEDEKNASAKSIMGKHSWACSISEQGRFPPALFRAFRRADV